jgi:hypothetical protein
MVGGGLLAYCCVMPGTSYNGRGAHDDALAARLRVRVQALAGDIGERRLGKGDSLDRARDSLVTELGALGYSVDRHEFGPAAQRATNLVATRAGSKRSDEIVVVGAHYDSAVGTPGANDNATGVAALLELARAFRTRPTDRTIRFVFFANEEPPFFQQALMGSLVYARACRARSEKIVAMLSLETLGHFTDEPESQSFPWPLGYIYPHRGNYVAFVGNMQSRSFVRDVLGRFRKHARIASEGIAAPQSIPGIAWSDHWSFWQVGYPALMITDTAPYRDAAYHEPFDLPPRIDYAALALFVSGLIAPLEELAH